MRILVVGWALVAVALAIGAALIYLIVRNGQTPLAAGSSPPAYTIVVDAEGMASAGPDVAYVTLGVDTVARTADEATATNSQAMAAVIQAVKSSGVPDKDIRTTDFSVTPVYAQGRPGETTPPAITGYRVRNTARVTVENVQDAGKVLDAGLQAGANASVGVSFGIKDNTSLQQQALHEAFQQARSKAEAIASSAGLKLSGTYSITESSVQPPRPLPAGVAQAAATSAATPIETGQLTVSAHLQATFQYAR